MQSEQQENLLTIWLKYLVDKHTDRQMYRARLAANSAAKEHRLVIFTGMCQRLVFKCIKSTSHSSTQSIREKHLEMQRAHDVDVTANAAGDFDCKRKKNEIKCKCKATGGTPPGSWVGTAVPSQIVRPGTCHHSSTAPPLDILPACRRCSSQEDGSKSCSCSHWQSEEDTKICSCSPITAEPSCVLITKIEIGLYRSSLECVVVNVFRWKG